MEASVLGDQVPPIDPVAPRRANRIWLVRERLNVLTVHIHVEVGPVELTWDGEIQRGSS